MSRRVHAVDELLRTLPMVSDERVRLESEPRAKQALFEEIVSMPTDTIDPPAISRPRRVPRRAVLLVATLLAVSVGAVGWAALNLFGSTTSVGCWISETGVTVIDSVTGDPVVDCATVWEQQTGQPSPELVAYDNATGGIAVAPVDRQVPGDWRPLEAGAAQDPRIIELRVALDDVIAGLPSRCHLLDDAAAVAEHELDRLDLDAWSVDAERGHADGTSTCTYFRLDAERQRVMLMPREGIVPPDDAPAVILARDLAEALDGECLHLDGAADLARRLARDAGIVGEGLVVQELVDDLARCARVHVNVFGRVEVTVRGPEAAD